jgi:RNase P/RNase MRP subunit p30
VTSRKRNESKSPLLMSKIAKTISKPQFVRRLRDKFRRNLITGGTVSGI